MKSIINTSYFEWKNNKKDSLNDFDRLEKDGNRYREKR
jgi:hypothetical protein